MVFSPKIDAVLVGAVTGVGGLIGVGNGTITTIGVVVSCVITAITVVYTYGKNRQKYDDIYKSLEDGFNRISTEMKEFKVGVRQDLKDVNCRVDQVLLKQKR
jgi:hypothetical protein